MSLPFTITTISAILVLFVTKKHVVPELGPLVSALVSSIVVFLIALIALASWEVVLLVLIVFTVAYKFFGG